MTVKYLIKNTDTNVIDMTFDLPVNTSPPLEQIMIPATQFRDDMDKSIWIDVNNYKPFPGVNPNGFLETWWVSDGTDWVDPRPDEDVWDEVRRERNEALAESDWTQLKDADITNQQQQVWTDFRQELRNIPGDNAGNPRNAETSMKDKKKNKPVTPGRGRAVGTGSPQ